MVFYKIEFNTYTWNSVVRTNVFSDESLFDFPCKYCRALIFVPFNGLHHKDGCNPRLRPSYGFRSNCPNLVVPCREKLSSSSSAGKI